MRGALRQRMEQQTAFITGATSGIGAATARVLAKAGYRLVLLGRRTERLAALAAELRDAHRAPVEAVELDVRDKDGLARLQRERPHLFDVDVLVNNAGLARGTEPLQEGNPDDWDEVLDTNVKGLLRVTRAVVPGMARRGRGHVVNLGSVAGRWVYPGGAVYCASKHAVRAINEGLRMDLHGSGVRVTTIDPGLVETEFSVVRFRGDSERAAKVYQGLQPLTPEDVAETILWCLSRPPHVNVQEVVLYPTAQASPTMVKRA
jgi:3-hydroxy acid dehydrogenase / malonic semialdehyde reductase